MGLGCIPVKTLLDHGINESANVSILSVAWLIRRCEWIIRRNSSFFLLVFYLFLVELFGLEI